MVCLFLLAFLLGVGSPFFPLASFDANAADPDGIQPFDHDVHITLERISPVTLAYHRLKAVLTNHGNERAVPFVLPAVSDALSNPLSLPALARRLTDQTGGLTPGSKTADVTPEKALGEFISKTAKTFSLRLDEKSLMASPPVEIEDPFSIGSLTDRMATEMASANLWVENAFSDISPEEKTRLLKLFPPGNG